MPRHWNYLTDEEGLGWLRFDHADKPLNVLSAEAITELSSLIDEVEEQTGRGRLRGLALLSGKENGFIAGADITEFSAVKSARQLQARLGQVNALFNRIEALPVPKVAALHGFCLGGGLELALTADWLIASKEESTRLGFPEVRLGLLPGFGGTVRSVRKLGGVAAMGLILSGKAVSAAAAKRLGLVEQLVKSRLHLQWAARKAMLQRRRRPSPGLLKRLGNFGPIRRALAWQTRAMVRRKVREKHYPAPYAIVELWRKYGGSPARMAERESESFIPLMLGETAKGLRRAFFLGEELKKQGGETDFKPTRVHVIGAGVMGGDIASWCVGSGMLASLQDNDEAALAKAKKRAKQFFRRRYKNPLEAAAAEKRFILSTKGEEISRAHVVIEAIVEKATAKKALLKTIEPQLNPEAVLATNTSSISLEELARSLKDPKRLIGLHFFNPVRLLPLVEVVGGRYSNPRAVSGGCAFVKAIKKSPLVVKSTPGFLVNRILAPYMFSALEMLEGGIDKKSLDSAALAFGMPMGPLELCDQVGLDVCLDVAAGLGFKGERGVLEEMVKEGRLGRKSGKGFYDWKNGRKSKKIEADFSPRAEKIADELISPMIKAAEKCLEEKIVPNRDLLDAGIIFGAGFAPFRGGILNYAEQRTREMSAKRKAK